MMCNLFTHIVSLLKFAQSDATHKVPFSLLFFPLGFREEKYRRAEWKRNISIKMLWVGNYLLYGMWKFCLHGNETMLDHNQIKFALLNNNYVYMAWMWLRNCCHSTLFFFIRSVRKTAGKPPPLYCILKNCVHIFIATELLLSHSVWVEPHSHIHRTTTAQAIRYSQSVILCVLRTAYLILLTAEILLYGNQNSSLEHSGQ